MSDSDDYGNEFDDTEIFEAATQVERKNTPAFQPSPRPSKRRKTGPTKGRTSSISSKQKPSGRRGPFISSDDDDSDSFDPVISRESSKAVSPPSCESLSEERAAGRAKRSKSRQKDYDEEDIEEISPARGTVAQKRKERIHVPTTNLDMADMFFTQPPQEHSPPWKPRGAIWAKPAMTTGVHRPSEPSKRPGSDATKTIPLSGRQLTSARPNGVVGAYDFTQDLADLPSDAFASSSSSPQKHNGDVAANSASLKRVMAPQTGLRQTTLFGRAGVNGEVQPSQVNKRYSFVVDQKQEPPTHHKLDHEAMKTWVYPTNLGTIRDYQFNIVQRGLFNNLLVALPTGLGKTFIAATIMLNWFRWTMDAQIVFVAPTKPLVSQQVGACFGIAGIPRSSTTMLTGGVSQALRAEEWKSKRVFFMTPQTLLNDLKAGYADPKNIVLLVVDEAHRATGAYAYVEVVSFLRRFNQSFRVLALTATPGADVESVQKVIDGLDISKVEIRTENSMDICSYVHQRKIEKHVFTNSSEMEMCMDLYSEALQPLVKTVTGLNAYYNPDPRSLTPYGCTQASSKWMQDAGRNANQGVKSIVRTVFSILASISHGMDLLKFHGIGPFHSKMKEFKQDSEKTKSKYKKQVLDSEAFKKLMVRLDAWVTDKEFIGHPKLEFLQEVILNHFANAEDGENPNTQTRIMVFAHFRDSAEEIARVLKRHDPMIRPRVFVGQSTAKNSEGMNQKEQLEVIEKFKAGTYNTLIATSIGEEGLDIGEVDLIICYDSKASPIRMLQRMGRTGRKREGKIVMLQMQGKEENDANKAKDSYEKMQELIANGSHFTFHDEISRRILPPDVRPTVDRRVIDIPPENSQQDWLPEPKKGRRLKKPPKKFHMPDGVLTGFVTAGRMDEEIVPKGRGKKAVALVYPSEELLDLPPLESVLLDDKSTKDLEQRFQTVYDDDDAPVVTGLDLSRHSDQQRILSDTIHLSGPGRVTRRFVKMMQRIHDMDDDRLSSFQRNLHYSDCESEGGNDMLVSEAESLPVINEDMWADDDPASQSLPKSKARAKPGPKPKPKAKAAPKTAPKAVPKATPAPRGRPRKDVSIVETPVRPSSVQSQTPVTKTPNWRVSALAGEGASSSPPPTDPRFRIASQADTIGSDDTFGDDEIQDTQAYKLDSELASFIVEDEDDDDIPPSSLPNLDLSGLGRGTQAVVMAARPGRRPVAEKLFTSDVTDNDAIVSSDSDEDAPLVRTCVGVGANKRAAVVVDSASEDDDAPVVSRKKGRWVVDDDEDEDE
ncbi:P-loop containing nucleoside triphosphate hydrolase protein, partial [Dothidotthia symphoricarpi CBS 119687]